MQWENDMKIINALGHSIKGVAQFEYSDHTIILDLLEKVPEVKVTFCDTVRTFKSIDDAIDALIPYSKEQFDLDSPV
jgi:hypothetical protein